MINNINGLVPKGVPPEFKKTYCDILSIALRYGVVVKSGNWNLVKPGHYVIIFSGGGYCITRGLVKSWDYMSNYLNLEDQADGDVRIDYVLEASGIESYGFLHPYATWYAKDDLVVVISIPQRIEAFRTRMNMCTNTKEW